MSSTRKSKSIKVHYALCDITACMEDVVTWQDDVPLIQHTTIEESVTCKECRKIIRDENKLQEYVEEYCQ